MKKGMESRYSPIGVFLVLYLGLGILFEYVLKIPMGFYNVPIVVCVYWRRFWWRVYRMESKF